MKLVIAALVLLQAVPAGPLLDNDFVRVFRNSAPCAAGAPSCGERVVVALGSIEVDGRKMEPGDVVAFKSGERYTAPKTGEYMEVAIKPEHPKVTLPAAGALPPPGNKILYDGNDFTVFAEKMQPDEYVAPHSHNLRVAIFLNDTNVQRWTDGKEETRELVLDAIMWRPAVVHASKDVGTVPIHNILIEFKH